MAKTQTKWAEFGWQGIRLRVPDDWNLGKVDGSPDSGYVRLDDAEIVRAEIEWRTVHERANESVEALVGRYIEGLKKKADKADLGFSVQRRAKFLKDKRWLEGRDYETFTWEADFRAFNLALKSPGGRILLLRLLGRRDEDLRGFIKEVMPSLEDHFGEDQWFWSVYGLQFSMPTDFKLESHELKSGHIQLSFEKGKEICRVQRLSLAQLLLKKQELSDWYPVFFKKKLRDMDVEVAAEAVEEHPGLRVTGKPRSRWRQLLRPLPWMNPRPRQYLDGRVWHCEETSKICVVEHLFRKKEQRGDLTERIADGYLCHKEAAEAEPRGHAQLETRSQ